jgi:cytochrome c oxidase cbb3-type subunit III
VTSSTHPPVGVATEAALPQVPERRQEPKVLEHEYDGIREYDNPLPGWWVAAFWASFVFSIGYAAHYHFTGNGQSIAGLYEEDMRSAREARAKESLKEGPSEAALGALSGDAQLMQDAKVIFAQRCVACHAAEGQGLIGPNLTDAHWIHGTGTLMDIYEVVSHGVLTKGMPAWELQLQPVELRKVVAYVGTLRDTNIPGKAPEGTAVQKP